MKMKHQFDWFFCKITVIGIKLLKEKKLQNFSVHINSDKNLSLLTFPEKKEGKKAL